MRIQLGISRVLNKLAPPRVHLSTGALNSNFSSIDFHTLGFLLRSQWLTVGRYTNGSGKPCQNRARAKIRCIRSEAAGSYDR